MGDFIIITIILISVTFSIKKIFKQKKSGGCSGCPSESQCSKKNNI